MPIMTSRDCALLVFLARTTVLHALNNGAALTPIKGFDGYFALGQHSGLNCSDLDDKGGVVYNEPLVVVEMDALVSTGLRDAGFVYVSGGLDCWADKKGRDATGHLIVNKRFPSGMAWLAKQAHDRGLKLTVGSSTGVKTCREDPGSAYHEDIDAQQFADWGADMAGSVAHGSSLSRRAARLSNLLRNSYLACIPRQTRRAL